MTSSSNSSDRMIRCYRRLLSIRPTQLGCLIKKLLFVRRRVTYAHNGCAYWIDPVSVFGFTLLSQQVYEESLSHVVETLLQAGDTFIDVGGNEGYFSILAARHVQNGQVLCVEPQKRLLPVIRR